MSPQYGFDSHNGIDTKDKAYHFTDLPLRNCLPISHDGIVEVMLAIEKYTFNLCQNYVIVFVCL